MCSRHSTDSPRPSTLYGWFRLVRKSETTHTVQRSVILQRVQKCRCRLERWLPSALPADYHCSRWGKLISTYLDSLIWLIIQPKVPEMIVKRHLLWDEAHDKNMVRNLIWWNLLNKCLYQVFICISITNIICHKNIYMNYIKFSTQFAINIVRNKMLVVYIFLYKIILYYCYSIVLCIRAIVADSSHDRWAMPQYSRSPSVLSYATMTELLL